MENPVVSIIVATYNRAHTIGRTLDSILKQTYPHFEVVVVDDGSKDNTQEVVKNFKDPRIRLVCHNINKGVCAAKNTGLDNIRGEWFTTVDSDDAITTDALESLIKVVMEHDSTITAVTCNRMDSQTRKFSGKGIDHSTYLTEKDIVLSSGDFWGIRKTSTLGSDRFNEKINGYESILWYKLNARSKTYYIHKALSIYYTEGEDRILKNINFPRNANVYEHLIDEKFYLNCIKLYNKPKYLKMCITATFYLNAASKKLLASFWQNELKPYPNYYIKALIINLLPPKVLKCLLRLKLYFR